MAKKSVAVSRNKPIKPVTTSSSNWQLYILAGAIAIVTLFSFSPSLNNSLINWDDNAYVFENKHLDKPLSESIAYFFGPHYFIGNYVPLTMTTLALEYQISGLEPRVFHTVNLLLHLLNVVLVFWCIYLLSGRKPLVAALVSLFFAVHPMHVESVAWVSELKDVLFTCFFMAGLIAYFKYLETKTAPLYPVKDPPAKKVRPMQLLGLAFYLFVLSVLSKPAAITFPVVLLLVDCYTRRKFDRRAILEKLPFFVVSVIFGIVAVNAQQADRLLHDNYPVTQRLFFASHSVLVYIEKLFLPFHLSMFYPYPVLVHGHLPYFYYVTPVIVALLFYGVYRSLRYDRVIAFGALFFIVNLVLVLQLLSIGDAIMADRYTYVPYLGLFFIIAIFFDRFYNSKNPRLKQYKLVALGAVIALAIASSALTYARCGVWENDITIADDLCEKFPNDRLVLNNKGFLLFNQHRYGEAVQLYNRAIQQRPDYTMAYINLVNTYIAMNNYDHALATTDSAIKIIPGDYNLFNARGYLLLKQNKFPEAISAVKAALALKKENINSYLYLAQCYYNMQDYATEIATLDQGLKYDPSNYILLNNKGYALYVTKRYDEAIGYLKQSLEIKPDYSLASANLANCYQAINDSLKRGK